MDGSADIKLPGERYQIVGVVAAVLFTVLFLSWVSSQRKRKYDGQLRPPGPRGWPLLGFLPSLGDGTKAHTLFFELSRKYGPLLQLPLGFQNLLLVSSAEMAKEVLFKNDVVFASRPPQAMGKFLYNQTGIALNTYGPHLRLLRKICNVHLFTTSRLAHFQGVREGETRAMLNFILRESEKGVVLNMCDVFGSMSGNIITQMIWKKRHNVYETAGAAGKKEIETESLQELVRKVLVVIGNGCVATFFPPFCQSVGIKLFGWEEKAKVLHAKLDHLFERELSEHEQMLPSISNSDVTDEDDFVHVLVKLSKDSDSLSRESIKAVLLDMLFAGTDTSAVTLEWALTELIRNPSLMRKAQDELKAVIGENRLVKEADIHNLNYLRAVVKETLRLHPAGALGISHYSTSDCQVGKFLVRANTPTVINIFAIHRDPAVWERPTEFNPNRFLDSRLDFKGHDFQFIPFGSGRRMCPGMNLGVATVHIALAQLLHAFSWSVPEEHKSGSLDTSDNIGGATCYKAFPLMLIAKSRLAHHVISS